MTDTAMEEDMSDDRKSAAPRIGAVTVALLTALLPAVAAVQVATASVPIVYHSANDDGVVTPSPVEIVPGAAFTVHLYIDGGSTASAIDPCYLGTGDEVCSWELTVEGQHGLDLVGFVASAGGVSLISGTTLKYVGGDAINGTLGPEKLGDLTVQGITGGILQLHSSKSVNSALGLDALLETDIVTVPEPGFPTGLIAGIAGLAVCARARMRRS
jgi:hypothetical protein